ncbi:MAG: hemolysin family protein [Caldimicrobium sp.]|nr:hemolysin family protein [Caldimicrobium sp.]
MVDLYLFLFILCLLTSFCLSCSEATIFSLSRIELADIYRNLSEKKSFAILKSPETLLFTILAGNEIADFLGGFFLSNVMSSLMDVGARTFAFTFALFSILAFYVADFIPKILGYTHRRRLIFVLLPFVLFLHKLFFPLNFALERLNILALLKRKKEKGEGEGTLSTAEQFILYLLDEARKAGKISEVELRFIRGLFISEDIPVSTIMVPRSEIYALPDQEITPKLLQEISKTPFTKIPVYGSTLDELIGILYVKDLFKHVKSLEEKKLRLSEVVRSAFFVPEFKKVRDLLIEFQKKHLKIALVVDEYGTIKGLVTLPDLLELLFGEFRTEDKPSFSPIKKLSEDKYLAHGNAPMYLIKEELEAFEISPEDESRSLNGFLLERFEGVPKVGDSLEVAGFTFKVLKVRKNKILWVEIWRKKE